MKRFAENNFRPINQNGRVIHPMLRLPVTANDRIAVHWISTASARPQGLAFRIRKPLIKGKKGYGGTLNHAGTVAPALALWMDTSPRNASIDVVKAEPGAELQISNRWRMPDGREDEWFQNYGMLITEESPNEFMLQCSDGIHEEPNFDDLVVRISLESSDRNT